MMDLTAPQNAALACLPLLTLMFAATDSPAGDGKSSVVLPDETRIRQNGNIRDDGTFSFWTNGVIGDWFVKPENGKIKVVVLASGRSVKGEGPLVALETISVDGEVKEVSRFSVVSDQYREYQLDIPIAGNFFGLQLRHLNRVAGESLRELRHLMLKELRVIGAEKADYGLTAFVFFRSRETAEESETHVKSIRTIETESLRVEIDTENAIWSVEHSESDCRLLGIQPVFNVRGLPIELSDYEAECSVQRVTDHKLGDFTKVQTRYRKEGALEIIYTLLISNAGHDIVAQVDFVNNTGGDIVVNSVASIVAQNVTIGGNASQWNAIGDGKRYSEPYETVTVADINEFESWWYVAAKNQDTGRSILIGNLTNAKGAGRLILLPAGNASMKIAAYNDYEGIVMPAGERITGEQTLLNFGSKGTDSLERFGELVARAHDIDLMKQHPIDPYVPEYLSLFNTWNGYGAGVVRDFDYKHDRTKYEKAFMDPQWTRANRKKLFELGLHDYGYAQTTGRLRGTPSPLVRRYGNPDFWFKDAQRIAEAHPEYYIDGHIDFSNPAVVEFEQERVARAFQDKTSIIRYGWDFTDRWRKLPGQYDPFMTSAETYRRAMGIWRDMARSHPPGAYAFIYMNVVGFNYDICDIFRAGQDSDQGYYGSGCTFTQGLVRQISGRYFYNGKVWWNNPDSFHVYVGGLYSYNQGKVHASFCAISGNVIYLSEPFTDQDTPEDRLEILRRVAPMTPDVSKAVDVFEHNPAQLWNIPVKRDFAQWNVVGLFNVDYNQDGKAITQQIAFEDLELSPHKEYLVYEFWSRQFLGVKKGSFTRTLQAPDCEIYSIVEKVDHPVLISTSRHVRHMAYDILSLKWDQSEGKLSGESRVVKEDPYQLRLFVPGGYAFTRAEAEDLSTDAKMDGSLLNIDFESPENKVIAWTVYFK